MLKRSILCLCMIALCLTAVLTGCGQSGEQSGEQSGDQNGDPQTTVTYRPKFNTTAEIGNYVLNYLVNVQENGETTTQLYAARIAGQTLGFKNFYNPKYGTPQVKQNPDGSYTVTVAGSMSGEFENGEKGKKVFLLTAIVTSETAMPQITIEEQKS